MPFEKQPSIELLADSKEFAELHPQLLGMIAATEMEMRVALTEMLQRLPPHVAVHLVGIVGQLPARFLKSHLWFYAELSALMKLGAAVAKAEQEAANSTSATRIQ